MKPSKNARMLRGDARNLNIVLDILVVLDIKFMKCESISV